MRFHGGRWRSSPAAVRSPATTALSWSTPNTNSALTGTARSFSPTKSTPRTAAAIWLAASYERRFAAGEPPDTLDKDFIRRWVAERCDPYHEPIPEIPSEIVLEAAARYIEAFETITGERFPLPDPSVPPLARIRANLAPFF